MSSFSIEAANSLIEYNRRRLAQLACHGANGDQLTSRVVRQLELSLKSIERHRDEMLSRQEQQPMMEVNEEERLTPAQQAHREFNEASARVDGLRRLIDMRGADRVACASLLALLDEAEAEKMAAHAELARTGRSKILSRVKGSPGCQ